MVFFVYNALLHLKCNAKASVKGHSQAFVELLRKGESPNDKKAAEFYTKSRLFFCLFNIIKIQILNNIRYLCSKHLGD
ncbi:hypothetical protein COI69_02420 [Bacillus cereus]|uniref:Uncharacterized protein n=1 Tax=Bacillus cereus TaxID=1396 RepID=A0A9X7EAW1_BACCE|nr:hypothetical protein COE70_32150 [Bacillus cereus]PHG84245.1 hypothetical protein COI69_02420 [Bacillus cereus]